MLQILKLCVTKPFYKASVIHSNRTITVSAAVCGRKTRNPYDRRFGIHSKDAAPNKPGGTRDFQQKVLRASADQPQAPGIYTKDGRFIFVKEQVPEFIVPDLKGFELKPYVSYRVPDIKQSEFTAKDLFDATYAKQIVEDFKAGKLNAEQIKERILTIKLDVKKLN